MYVYITKPIGFFCSRSLSLPFVCVSMEFYAQLIHQQQHNSWLSCDIFACIHVCDTTRFVWNKMHFKLNIYTLIQSQRIKSKRNKKNNNNIHNRWYWWWIKYIHLPITRSFALAHVILHAHIDFMFSVFFFSYDINRLGFQCDGVVFFFF